MVGPFATARSSSWHPIDSSSETKPTPQTWRQVGMYIKRKTTGTQIKFFLASPVETNLTPYNSWPILRSQAGWPAVCPLCRRSRDEQTSRKKMGAP